ncbi:MAG: hypothetical protein HUK23_03625 [Sphaerochaetaceae bacterium]|nr:hypothetical protein [Sphaerochaetaceae bacterium]
MTAATGKWFRLYLMDGDSSVIELYDSNVNGLCYRNQNASDIKIQDIIANTWYKIRLDIDIANNLYSIYVNDVFKKSGCTFRRPATKIDAIKLESGSSFTGQGNYKDFNAGYYTLAKDIFDSQAINTQPQDWSLVVPANTSCLIEEDSSNNHCVTITDNNTTQQVSMTKTFPSQTGIIVTEFSLKDSAVGTWSRILIGNGNANAIEIYNSDLYGLCYKDSNNVYHQLLIPQSDTWYKFKLVSDISTKRFDIYINDQIHNVGCTFKNVITSINKVVFASGESYIGITRFKGISVKQGVSQ